MSHCYLFIHFGASRSPWYFLCSNVPPPASWGESHAWPGSYVCLDDHGICDLLRPNWGWRKPLHLASTRPYHNIYNQTQFMKPNVVHAHRLQNTANADSSGLIWSLAETSGRCVMWFKHIIMKNLLSYLCATTSADRFPSAETLRVIAS